MTRALLVFAGCCVAAAAGAADGRSVPGTIETLPEYRPAPQRALQPRACNRGARTWTPAESRCVILRVFPTRVEGEAVSVATCESRLRATAVNSYSHAKGLFQFIPSTWAGEWNPYRRQSALDPVYNARAANVLYHRIEGGVMLRWRHWNCKP